MRSPVGGYKRRPGRRARLQLSAGASKAVLAAGIFLGSFLYLLMLRGYGFQLEDEGTLLFQLQRAAQGQDPYLDFHTGYTPGFFALGGAVMGWADSPTLTLRLLLAVINAAAAAALGELTRRMAGIRLAALAPLLWLAFVPVFVGEFAAFNVPYPTWPVTLAWIAAALALISWVNQPRVDKLVVVGLLAAGVLWLRPNSGAFLLAGATWVVCAVASRQSLLDSLAAMAATGLMAFGIWYTFRFQYSGMDAVVHLVPVLAITVLVGGRESHLQSTTPASCAVALIALAAAFVLPTLWWMAPLHAELGHDRFLFDVLLVGADYQSLYYHPHPPLEPYATAVVGGAAIFALVGRLTSYGRMPAVVPAFLLASTMASTLWMAATTGLAPEGTAAAVSAQLENASYWFAIAANFAALAYLVLAPGLDPRRSGRTRVLVVAALMAVAMYLQMYPRSDFMHQITAAPLTIAVAVALLSRVVGWWGRGAWPKGVDGPAVAAAAVWSVAAVAVSIKLFANLQGPVAAWRDPGPDVDMPQPLPVHVEAKAAGELEAIARVAAFLRQRTAQGEPVWSFPATSGLLYAAGRSNPLPHDYWFPGRPSRDEELRMLELLRESSPQYGVTLNDGWTFFEASPEFFAETRRYLVENYRLAARYGRFDVMVRRSEPAAQASSPPAAQASSQPAAQAAPQTEAPAAGEPAPADLEQRRAAELEAVRRGQAGLAPAMPPEQAARASLPEDPADAVRLLRALRDGGDMRAAAWAMLGFASQHPSIRGEALGAMLALETSLRMHRLRLADDFDPALYRPFVLPLADLARELHETPRLEGFAAGVLELAGQPVPVRKKP